MNFFDSWGKQLANGDWLSVNVLHPLHSWHRNIATEYYRLNPEKLAEAQQSGVEPVRYIWEIWCGGKRFYQDPLYPYLIGFTYKILGQKVVFVFFWQMLLGVTSNVLIFLICRRLFGPLASFFSAILVVFYSPLVFYELVLVRSTCITFFSLLLVLLTCLAMEKKKRYLWLSLGICAGLAVLLKAHFLLFFAGLILALIIRLRKKSRLLLKFSLYLIVGFLLAVFLLIARNLWVGVSPFCTTSAGGFTFIGANTPDYHGESFYLSMKHGPLIMGKTDGKLFPAMFETLKTHSGILSYPKLILKKFNKVWHWYEIPNNANLYYYTLHSLIIRKLPVNFILVAPLALIGLILALKRFYRCWPLYLCAGIHFTILLLFFVMGRYRVPMAAILIPFAALTLTFIVKWLSEKKYKPFIITAAVILVLIFWCARPLTSGKKPIRSTDYFVAYKYYYGQKAETARKNNDFEKAAFYLGEALKFEPDNIRYLSLYNLPKNNQDKKLANLFGNIHLHYADALLKCGYNDKAREHQKRSQLLLKISKMKF